MTAILNFLRDEDKLRKWLFVYWLLSPFVVFFYTYTVSAQTGTSFRDMLQDGSVALTFLVSCMSIIMAFLLRTAGQENENTERIFCIFAIVQQLLVGNPPGFLLSYFLVRLLWDAPRQKFAPTAMRWVLLGGMVLIGFLTFLTLIARFHQLFGA